MSAKCHKRTSDLPPCEDRTKAACLRYKKPPSRRVWKHRQREIACYATRRIGWRDYRWGRLAHPNKLFQSISTRDTGNLSPENACDCHTHYSRRPAGISLLLRSRLHAELASPEEMSALHRMLHIERVVIVTPSLYGTDNSSTLFGMKARGADARGMAVIDDKTTESDLDAMARAASAAFGSIRHRRHWRSQHRPPTFLVRGRPFQES